MEAGNTALLPAKDFQRAMVDYQLRKFKTYQLKLMPKIKEIQGIVASS